ncbi:MAG: TIGR04282 family arsenosugar biosynthesis glycosyltransferase [Bacteroidia bacterium]|nr:TIGR04282 family arsenosugar biosynthesis glycosyltransferase [Bacteroidia bacterium]
MNQLMIFVKNPELGKVKTRLASSIGVEAALEVYRNLLNHTRRITIKLECQKTVGYSQFVDDNDIWDNSIYDKELQIGHDLGEKMSGAFQNFFQNESSKVVIIGSDCSELTKEIIEESFIMLDDNDVVIGPAKDGGYYLLGMKKYYPQLFENKKWSTNSVLSSTIVDLENLEVDYHILQELSDIDRVEDLKIMVDQPKI